MDKEQKKAFLRRLKTLVGEMPDNSFAKKCDIPGSTMRGYLDGTTRVSHENLLKISKACGVSVGWLAAGEEAVTDREVEEARQLREQMARHAAKIRATIEPGNRDRGGQQKTQDGPAEPKLSDLLTMAARVLESDTAYGPALSTAIKAYAVAVEAEAQITALHHENLQTRNSQAALEERLADLEHKLTGQQENRDAG